MLKDRQIRSLFEYDVRHRKVNNFKFGKLMPVSTFVAVTYWYGVKERVGCEFFTYRKKFGRIYDTYNYFGSVPAVSGRGQGVTRPGAVDAETA